ncbi:MAG: ribosome maturation factor RimP [Rickettsiaceae bacterium]
MEEKITALIESAINDLGLDLVKLTFQGGSRKILEIHIDRKDSNKVTVKDCRDVSRNISAILDVEDIIKDKYFLEVSSAGVERPLVKLEDFERFTDREIRLKLKEPHNGKISFKGKLIEVKNRDIIIKSKNVQLVFSYDNIKGANLVLTDEIFRQLLKGTK